MLESHNDIDDVNNDNDDNVSISSSSTPSFADFNNDRSYRNENNRNAHFCANHDKVLKETGVLNTDVFFAASLAFTVNE